MMFEMSQLDMTSEERDICSLCVVVVAGKIVRRWVVLFIELEGSERTSGYKILIGYNGRNIY